MSTDGIADGVSDVDVDAELVVDGLLLDLSSSLPQATVAKSNETAEAARATRLMV
ncbi:hypothetical protein GCM10009554_33220 [Kribbella koreensis]|uniref:Uncharacterized protein n=1 Tax=Kribbella koreensis TaxID=57909 RepID=A0ABP4AZ87_9ACTN